MDGGWPAPFDTDPAQRRRLGFELVDGAARLARVEWRAQGLEGFGRLDRFHEHNDVQRDADAVFNCSAATLRRYVGSGEHPDTAGIEHLVRFCLGGLGVRR
jgi:hypothetical protein